MKQLSIESMNGFFAAESEGVYNAFNTTNNFAFKLSVGELSRECTHKGMQTTYNQHVDFVDSNDEVVFSFDMQAVNHWGMQQHDYCEDTSYTDTYASLDEKSKEKYPQHKNMLQNIINSCVDVYDDSHVSDDSDEFTGHIKFHYHLSDYAIEQLAIIIEAMKNNL